MALPTLLLGFPSPEAAFLGTGLYFFKLVEAAELLEPFQWLTEAESQALPDDTLAAVRQEMADVLLYLVRLADRLDVDLAQAARDKIALNAVRYPVERSRGRRTRPEPVAPDGAQDDGAGP